VRRKVLNDLINAIADMIVPWLPAHDLERIVVLPDGTIEFDVITGSATHDAVGPIELNVGRNLLGWLESRLAEKGIPLHALAAITISVSYRTDRIAANREKIVPFDWKSRCRILAEGREYVSRTVEKRTWYTRAATFGAI
jgi:hypothetical protein